MISSTVRWLLVPLFLALSTTQLLAKKEELPEVTVEGLHRLPDSRMAVVYVRPGATLSGYKRVMLLDAHVAFKKNWERDQRRKTGSYIRISSSDIERIKTQLAEAFQEDFREVLEENGYEVVDGAGEDVLLVRPAIVNLDPNAPDNLSPGRVQTYVESAGEMSLYVELYDSVTSDLIAKALDRKADNSNVGYYTWANRATNRAAADRILKGWANILVDALDDARESATAEGEPAAVE